MGSYVDVVKRRRKGNPVVSTETVTYGCESSATLTTDRLHYKLQTLPLVREGASRQRAKQLSGKRKEKRTNSIHLKMGLFESYISDPYDGDRDGP
jgi:hypothetical protein